MKRCTKTMKCEKTMSGKHFFDYGPRGAAAIRAEISDSYLYVDKKDVFQLIPPRCIACGLINDLPKRKKI